MCHKRAVFYNRHCWQHYHFIGSSTMYMCSPDFINRSSTVWLYLTWPLDLLVTNSLVFCVRVSDFVGQSKTSLHFGLTTHLNNFPSWHSVSLDFKTVMGLDRYLALRRRVRYRSVFKFCHCYSFHRWLTVHRFGHCFKNFQSQTSISNLFLSFSLMFSSYFCIRTYLSLC